MKYLFAVLLALLALPAGAVEQTKGSFVDKFRQLEEELPTPNMYRNAAGEPAPAYWQQQADYEIDVRLDENNRTITGSETIRYSNNSPDTLRYLWLQLDQNKFHRNSMDSLTRTVEDPKRITYNQLRNLQFIDEFDGGFKIAAVEDEGGRPLPHTITGTLMRIDLPRPLAPGKKISFKIGWSYQLVDSESARSQRDGFEYFPQDGNDIFLLAQWYPRMVAYSDYEAWHNKEFIGRGEFTLEFGDFDVRITVPADHVVSSTGELKNPGDVLSSVQQQRLKQARSAEHPVFIVTPDEALQKEAQRDDGTSSWHFIARNVRDFAWASSRKFIWDAQGYRQNDADMPFVMAMSFYPKEGEPLWSKYSTQAVIHTLEVYSRYSFAFPYPVIQSVNGPAGGMEYPMITFNGPRTELQEDGSRTYSRSEKRFLIGVVIHEVGHGYFPMIVNSDERQWTWMDEGLNTFLQFLAQSEWRSKALLRAIEEDKNFYMMEFSSPGGLVMPVLLQITYTDGSDEMLRIPAEIWRFSPGQVNKLIARDREIATIVVDPYWETADVDVTNNHYPRQFIPSRLEIYKDETWTSRLPDRDLMQDIKTELDNGEKDVPLRVESQDQ